MVEDYETGYGRPPKHSRFKKGQSGNPAGRPRGSPNFKTELRRAAKKKVSVRMGDRTRTMGAIEAMAHKLVQKALGGDLKAIKEVVELGGLDDSFAEAAQSAGAVREEDFGIVRHAFARGGGRPSNEPDPAASVPPPEANRP